MTEFQDKDKEQIIYLNNIANGDQQAFKKIFDIYSQKVYNYSLKYLHSDSLAKNAVQDIFLKIWENRIILPEIKDFNNWLFRILRNYLINTLKKAASEKQILDEIKSSFVYDDEAVKNNLLEKERLLDRLHVSISELPAQRQKVFTLCHFKNKSYSEIADILNITTSTVNDHMVKAMKYLRKTLLFFL